MAVIVSGNKKLSKPKSWSQPDPAGRVIAFLRLSDEFALPRKRWLRKWQPPPGTEVFIELEGLASKVQINRTGNYYSLSWHKNEEEETTDWETSVTILDSDHLHIELVKQCVTQREPIGSVGPLKNMSYEKQEYSVSNSKQGVMAQKLCEWLGL